MNLLLYLALTEPNSNFPRPIYKEFKNINLVPHIGEHVDESLRDDPHEVVDVDFDYQRNYCTVYLKPEKLQCSFEEYSKMAKMHGWVTSLTETEYC